MSPSFLYAAARTPFGRFGGALRRRAPRRPRGGRPHRACWPGRPASTRPGSTTWCGATRTGPARTTATSAGWRCCSPGCRARCPATTVNRLCGSSLDAAMMASRAIESGDAEIVVAGGVESMTRAPWVLPKPSRAFPAGNVTAVSTTLGWRLVNPRMPAEWTVSLGECQRAARSEKFGISRERQDAFAARSHQLAAAAWDGRLLRRPGRAGARRRPDPRRGHPAGHHGREAGRPQAVVPPGRHHHRRQRLAAQRRRRRPAHRLARPPPRRSAPSRSPGSPAAARHALDPQMFGFAPVEAADAGAAPGRHRLVRRRRGRAERGLRGAVAGLRRRLGHRPRHRQHPGGAIAIGHPLGASGGRILGTLAHVLRERRRAVGRGGDLHRRRPGAWPSSWRTPDAVSVTAVITDAADGGRRRPGRRHGAGRRVRHGRACRSQLIDALIGGGAAT